MGDDGFPRLGNHPALDLCNSRPMAGGERVELLGTFDDLARWARGTGIAVPDLGGAAAEAATLSWARDLRERVRALVDPTADGSRASASGLDRADPDRGEAGRAEAVRALNALLAGDAGVLRLRLADGERDGDGRPVVGLAGADAAAQLRLDLARAVLDIFAHDLRRVGRCGNPACVLLFLDTSRGRRRRWCSMAACGNRAKAAAHYARHHR